MEYVSAPREYEELLQAKEEPEASDNGFAHSCGLGFVSAGASGAGLGSGGKLVFALVLSCNFCACGTFHICRIDLQSSPMTGVTMHRFTLVLKR